MVTTVTRKIRMIELALAVEGMALMRDLFEDEPVTAQRRLDEIGNFIARGDEPPFSLALEFPERSVIDGYAEWATSYDLMPNPLMEIVQAIVEDLLADGQPGKALDVACGTGRLTRPMVAAGHDTLGMDCSREMLAAARQNLPRVPFCHGQLEELPMRDGRFDLVTCGLALTHLQHLGPAVLELARVTRPGGRVIIADIHPTDVAFGGHAAYPVDGSWGFIRNHFHAPSSYLEAFARAGLRVRRCLEPAHTEETANRQPSAMVAPEATRRAFVGLPIALIWDLARGA